jgi:hypothetical protein
MEEVITTPHTRVARRFEHPKRSIMRWSDQFIVALRDNRRDGRRDM